MWSRGALQRIARRAGKTHVSLSVQALPVRVHVRPLACRWMSTSLKLDRAPSADALHGPMPVPAPAVSLNLDAVLGRFSEMGMTENDGTAELAMDPEQMTKARKTLATEFRSARKLKDLPCEQLREVFLGATHTRMFRLQVQAFEAMQAMFPLEIDENMYKAVSRTLVSHRMSQKLWTIYQLSRKAHDTVALPEIVRCMGVTSKTLEGDMETAQAMVDEMQQNGIPISNEIKSRLMEGYARTGDKEHAMEVYASMSDRIGHWSESETDRVILSLGVVGEPEHAFEFYMNADMQLTESTLIVLLSVCVHNDCHQQASDILANRKRFKMNLSARGYHRILETLVFLDRREELVDVLQEMRQKGINTRMPKIEELIRANQDVLVGTPFERQASKFDGDDGGSSSRSSWWHVRKSTIMELKTLVQQNKVREAAALADQYVHEMPQKESKGSDGKGSGSSGNILQVHSMLSNWAVGAYVRNGDHGKVEGILKGVQYADQPHNYTGTVNFIVKSYENAPDGRDKLAYRAAQLLLHYQMDIPYVYSVLRVLAKYHDVDGMLTLWDYMLSERASLASRANRKPDTNLDEDDEDNRDGEYSRARPLKVIRDALMSTLFSLGKNNAVEQALDIIDKAHSRGMHISRMYFDRLLRGMASHSSMMEHRKRGKDSPHEKEMFVNARAFEAVMDKMKSYGFEIRHVHVRRAINALANGDENQRAKLLQLYSLYCPSALPSMRNWMYTALLTCAARQGDAAAAKKIFVDALANKDEERLKEWSKHLVVALINGGFLQEAYEHTLQIPSIYGAAYFPPVILVLRAAVAAGSTEIAESMLEQMRSNNFQMNASNLQELVRHARRAAQMDLAVKVVCVFQEINAAHERATGESMWSPDEAFKIRGVFRSLLFWCEEKHEWKHALEVSRVINEFAHDPSGRSAKDIGKEQRAASFASYEAPNEFDEAHDGLNGLSKMDPINGASLNGSSVHGKATTGVDLANADFSDDETIAAMADEEVRLTATEFETTDMEQPKTGNQTTRPASSPATKPFDNLEIAPELKLASK